MATCDSLQPVVVLTDVMDSNLDQKETVFAPDTEEQAPSSDLFQIEQTEPLDLCLNGTILNGSTMTKSDSSTEENETLDEPDDDDVIFVKEYKVKKARLLNKCNSQKISGKGEPRRNPVRKARNRKRFKEFTDLSFDEEEFLSDSVNDENFVMSENFLVNDEDSEDWKIENIPKKSKPKRKVFSRRFPHRLGRRKINKVKEEEKKVKLDDLEPLIESNLLLMKDYINDIKTLNKLIQTQQHCQPPEEKIQSAVEIFKQQTLLLTAVKEDDFDLYKLIFG